MSFLRRRFGATASDTPEPSPDASTDTDTVDHLRVIHADKLQDLKAKPHHKKRGSLWIFTLGGVFGLAVAAFFAGSNDMIDFSGFGNLEGMNLDSIMDILPQGFLSDAQQLQVSLPGSRLCLVAFRGEC
jgi:phospholipid:diacylglycerol acyltransferase